NAELEALVLDLADLLRVGQAERAAEDREVLREESDGTAVDPPESGDDAVPGELLRRHPEVGGRVLDEHVDLVERALVDEERDALARGHLPRGVLFGDFVGPAALERLASELVEAGLAVFGHGAHNNSQSPNPNEIPTPNSQQPTNRQTPNKLRTTPNKEK